MYDPPSRSGTATISRLLDSIRAATTTGPLSDLSGYFCGLYRNDKVNWGQVVFLTTCIVAMTGCGLVSSLVRRKWSRSSVPRRTSRHSSKSSSKALSSSEEDDYEDEDYDSNASLRHGTNPNYKPKEDWLSEPQKQSSDGTQGSWSWFRLSLTFVQLTRRIPAFSRNSRHITHIQPQWPHIPPSEPSTALIPS